MPFGFKLTANYLFVCYKFKYPFPPMIQSLCISWSESASDWLLRIRRKAGSSLIYDVNLSVSGFKISNSAFP